MWNRFYYLLLVLTTSWMLPLRAAAQTTDDLFNGDVLQEIRLTINPKDWLSSKRTI